MIGSTISHYRLVRSLGKGSFGEVFEGVHVHDDHFKVAVKVLHPSTAHDEEFITSLKAECRLLDRLKHPGIVGFRELVIRPGQPPAMVLDLISGGSLEARIERGPMAAPAVVDLLASVLDALAYAHNEGVVHRDIKPGNILLDARGRPLLVDFGIAKAADSGRHTKTGAALGTLAYMAPELFDGVKASPRSDLYAVGLVGWELLAGRQACDANSLMGAMRWHTSTGPPPIDRAVEGVPGELARALSALTAMTPDARPASASAARAKLVGDAEAETPTNGHQWSGTVEVDTLDRDKEAARRDREHGTVVLPPPGPAPAPAPTPAPVPGPARPGGTQRPLVLGVVGVLALAGVGWAVKGTLDSQEEERARSAEAARVEEAARLAEEARVAEVARTGIEEWVTIPGGSFEMGSESGDDDERPVHTVRVSSFELMKTEVTVGQYRKCVEAGDCAAPEAYDSSSGWKKYCNWGQSGREDHPLNCVDWTQAQAFAKWAGGRLPTEAEWEYAARSGGKSWTYPWGPEGAADCTRAVMDDGGKGCGEDRTWPVCSKPAGNSTHGVCDLAGNVWEWVQDTYHDTYNGAPDDGTALEGDASYRVNRGGSWFNTASDLRASNRRGFDPSNRLDDLGFRLAR